MSDCERLRLMRKNKINIVYSFSVPNWLLFLEPEHGLVVSATAS